MRAHGTTEEVHRVISSQPSPALPIHRIRIHLLHQPVFVAHTSAQRLHHAVLRELPVAGGRFWTVGRRGCFLEPLSDDDEFGEKGGGVHDCLR